MTVDDIFAGIVKHADDGVDFITVHCGVTRSTVERMSNEGRIMDVVSRGGAFTIEWMAYNKRENPLYEEFDRLLEITREYDMVLSLGDGFRPGCLADATDRAQIHELIVLGELTQRAQAAGVQVMIEGPGHVPLNQIAGQHPAAEAALPRRALLRPRPAGHRYRPRLRPHHLRHRRRHRRCSRRRFPLLRHAQRAPAAAGRERRRAKGSSPPASPPMPPTSPRGYPAPWIGTSRWRACRKKLDWEGQFALALDPERARRLRTESGVADHGACTMCGEFCAYKVMDSAMEKEGEGAGTE